MAKRNLSQPKPESDDTPEETDKEIPTSSTDADRNPSDEETIS